MDSVGDGEGGKIWENGIETCKKKKKECTAFIYLFFWCKSRAQIRFLLVNFVLFLD